METVDSLEVAEVLERSLEFIDCVITASGNPSSPRDGVKGAINGLDLLSIWESINCGTPIETIDEAISIMGDKDNAVAIMGSWCVNGAPGVRAIMSDMTDNEGVISTIVEIFPVNNLIDALNCLERKKHGNDPVKICGINIDNDFGEVLESYVKKGLGIRDLHIPAERHESVHRTLSSVYGLVHPTSSNGTNYTPDNMQMAKDLLLTVDPNLRINDETDRHSLRCHADRLSVTLWLQSGYAVQEAKDLIARKVYILASSMRCVREFEAVFELHVNILVDICKILDKGGDVSLLAGLLPSMHTALAVTDRISDYHGDYKYMLGAMHMPADMFVGLREGITSALSKIRTESDDDNFTHGQGSVVRDHSKVSESSEDHEIPEASGAGFEPEHEEAVNRGSDSPLF